MGVSHKGAISLGLLYIPVGLYTTTRDNDIRFNQLCKDTKERVRYKKYCPSCNKEVKSDEIIKGYEYESGKYVIMTQEEIEKIKTKKDKTIHIIQFVNLPEIDQIYYEKTIMPFRRQVPRRLLSYCEPQCCQRIRSLLPRPL